MWTVLDAMTHSRAENIGTQTAKRQEHKLTNLIKHIYPHKSLKVATKSTEAVTVVNLSSKELSEDTVSVLSRGLNFAPTPRRIPVEDIITNIENTIFRNKIPHGDADCLRQDVSTLLRKSPLPKSNITLKEVSALRELRNDESLLVLPADKGNATVVVDTEAYEHKITQMVGDTSVYCKVSYNPTSRVTTKVNKLLHIIGDKELVAQLRPLNPTPPKIYGLPKIHKSNWPLRPIVSQIDAPTYKLSRHLATLLQPHTGKTSSYVRDSRHFVELLEGIQLQDTDIMVSFDITSLFTNVPVDEVIQIITTLLGGTTLPTGYVESITYCLKSGYFLWRGDFYLQIDGVAMGSPLAPVVANIFMEWFEEKALESANVKPRYWWRYVDDIFAVVARDSLKDLTSHLNRVHAKIEVTIEEEKEGKLPFLDVLVIREPNGRVTHTVYRKPTHTDRYLRADSHHHPSHLSSVPRTLLNRALALCDHDYVNAELRWLAWQSWRYGRDGAARPAVPHPLGTTLPAQVRLATILWLKQS
ncbi:uncharacterized protein LOC113508689 [Trichoplusia ni]|uniref:Uncharacterized protein LOC113508689 n=1 Tax=Trichoplusia ni TaxID=7111 RepID=A0A7E5X2Z4_TRINI|nr:uncharacterized protein LOC113508689 [Trichoplusia ni]